MPSTKTLRESRANIWSQMTEIMAEADKRDGGELTAEEETKYAAAETELDQIEGRIALQERHEARDAEFRKVNRDELPPEQRGKPGGRDDEKRRADGKETEKDAQYRKAFVAYMRRGYSGLTTEQRSHIETGFVEAGEEIRAQGVAAGTSGGYTVPALFRNQIIERMKFVSSVRAVADHIETDSGANLPWPTVDDTGNIGAILAENTAVSDQDVTFGTASLDAYVYTSKQVRVSKQLMQDAGFDIGGWLAKALGTRIARIQNQHFTTGTGSSQPDGLVTGAVVGKVGAAGQVATITYDDYVDLIDSLDPAYLNSANLKWMMSQAIRKVTRKLKDSQGRPLWEPSLQVGQPDTLLGYGLVLNNDMPAPGASNKSVVFGDYEEAYVVRDVAGLEVVRLEERYAEYRQVGFIGFQRTDATLQNSYAVTAYQHPAA